MTTSLIREALALSISGGMDPVEMQWFDITDVMTDQTSLKADVLMHARPPAVREPIHQALTDPENQPNQYGIEFGMRGSQMTFTIGSQSFTLAYEPDEPGEFEYMRDMLIKAFSIFTPDVKIAVSEPLTRQALKAVIASVPEPDDDHVGKWVVAVCRAVEAAHGIGVRP